MTLTVYLLALGAYGIALGLLTTLTRYQWYTTVLLWIGLIAASPLWIPLSLVYVICDGVYRLCITGE